MEQERISRGRTLGGGEGGEGGIRRWRVQHGEGLARESEQKKHVVPFYVLKSKAGRHSHTFTTTFNKAFPAVIGSSCTLKRGVE